jgi:hypothetical protein
VAGRVPATHVFEEGCVDRREGVDDRDEPGQGGLELFRGLSKQPVSFNRTAVEHVRPRGTGGCGGICYAFARLKKKAEPDSSAQDEEGVILCFRLITGPSAIARAGRCRSASR